MARSGSTNFAVTRDDIIKYALQDIGRLTGFGTSPTTEQTTHAAWKLNVLIKRDMIRGLHLWAVSEGTLFLVASREAYTLGTGGDKASASYVKTELASAAASGAATVTVDSATGISSADVIGVELDDGSIHWTTVNGAPAAGVITLTAVTTGAAALDNHVYAYTTIIEKPVRILKDSIRLENADGIETPVTLLSRNEYFNLSNKATTGKASQAFYDRTYGDTGTLYVWPTADSVKDVLHFKFERTLQDMDAATDNPDYPIEATDYLVKALRYELCAAYGIQSTLRIMFKQDAEEARDEWLDWNSEDSSIFLQPNNRW